MTSLYTLPPIDSAEPNNFIWLYALNVNTYTNPTYLTRPLEQDLPCVRYRYKQQTIHHVPVATLSRTISKQLDVNVDTEANVILAPKVKNDVYMSIL